jgi:hypothetical protein
MALNQEAIKAIEHYISEHGFGAPKPLLSSKLSADMFREHYYDKKELIKFCRSTSISTLGLKHDLNQRIDVFLRTGQVITVTPKKKLAAPDSETGLWLDKQVVNYKSDLMTRQFFQKHMLNFTSFSALVQKQMIKQHFFCKFGLTSDFFG